MSQLRERVHTVNSDPKILLGKMLQSIHAQSQHGRREPVDYLHLCAMRPGGSDRAGNRRPPLEVLQRCM